MYECRDGPEEARQLFVNIFAAHHICRLGGSDHLTCQSSRFSPVFFIPNDAFWYVVPRGANPGVYEGRQVLHVKTLTLTDLSTRRTAYRMAGEAAESILRCESERAAYRLFVDLYMSAGIQEN